VVDSMAHEGEKSRPLGMVGVPSLSIM
jgi:hypothetical protein